MSPEAIADGVAALSELPLLRDDDKVASPGQLKAIIGVVGNYLDSSSTKTPPSKEELSEAVQSLLPKGEKLTRKWNKEQLTLVLTKWAVQAIRLQPSRAQKDLFVSVCVSDRDPKKMKHTCFLEDPGTGNVAAFALDSPSVLFSPCHRPSGSAHHSTRILDRLGPLAAAASLRRA